MCDEISTIPGVRSKALIEKLLFEDLRLDESAFPKQIFFHTPLFTAELHYELESYNFIVQIEQKVKKTNTVVDSAFIKANTKLHIFTTNVKRVIADRIPENAVCKVKFEIDTDPPSGASFDVGYIDDPVPFSIRSYDKPSLFAGKMAALPLDSKALLDLVQSRIYEVDFENAKADVIRFIRNPRRIFFYT